MAVELEEIFARFGVKVDKGSFSEATGALEKIKLLAIGIGAAFSAASVAQTVRTWVVETVAFAGDLNDLSAALDVSTDKIQEWTYGLGMAGGSQDDLISGVRTLSANLQAAAADGAGPAAKALRNLGVSWAMIRKQDVEGSLLKIADATAGGKADLAETMDVLGKSALKLRPWLAGGRSGIGEMAADAHELGGVLDTEVIGRLDDVGDSWDRAGVAQTSLKRSVVTSLLPAVEAVSGAWETFVRAVAGPTAALVQRAVDGITEGFHWLVDQVREVLDLVASNDSFQDFFAQLGVVAGYVWDLLSDLWPGVVAILKLIALRVVGTVKAFIGFFDVLWRVAKALGLVKLVMGALMVAWAVLKIAINVIVAALEGLGDVLDWIGDTAAGAADLISDAFHGALDWIMDVLSDIGDFFNDLWQRAQDVGGFFADVAWRVRHPLSGPRPSGMQAAEAPGVPTAAIIGGVNAPGMGAAPRVDIGPWGGAPTTRAAPTVNNNSASIVVNSTADAAKVGEEVEKRFKKFVGQAGAAVPR